MMPKILDALLTEIRSPCCLKDTPWRSARQGPEGPP